MKAVNKTVLKRLIYVALTVAAVVILAYTRNHLENREAAIQKELDEKDSSNYSPMVSEDHPLLIEYKKRHPDQEVILACSGELSGDESAREDLAIIATKDDSIFTVILVDDGGELWETEPIPAPREEQKIKIFDMDKAAPSEVLVTGSKNGNVGYALYRIMKGKLVDLFGEGMEDCC